jgi:hypothetical protein
MLDLARLIYQITQNICYKLYRGQGEDSREVNERQVLKQEIENKIY